MTTYPNLEKLNTELAKAAKALGLPEFRSHVDASGRNLVWLRKVLLSDVSCPEELKKLLNLPQVELMKAIQNRGELSPNVTHKVLDLSTSTPQIAGIEVTEGFDEDASWPTAEEAQANREKP